MLKKTLSLLLSALVLVSASACSPKYTDEKLTPPSCVATSDEAETTAEKESSSTAPTKATETKATEAKATTSAKAENVDKAESGLSHSNSGSGNGSNSGSNNSGNSSDYSDYESDYEDYYTASDVSALLNSAPLNPMKTNEPALDEMIDDIFSEILSPSMSTYEKVKACYDYLVDNLQYGSQIVVLVNDPCYKSELDRKIVSYAGATLSSGIGVCDQYTMCFVVMCRRIGLEVYPASGQVVSQAGGYTGHAWPYIVLNGTNYVFDPQVQSNNPDWPYYYFGKTYGQLGDMYRWNEHGNHRAYEFCNFETEPIYDFSLTETQLEIPVGESLKAQAQGLPEDTVLTWSSEDENIVKVDQNGVVTAISEGQTYIDVSAQIGTKYYSDYCRVYTYTVEDTSSIFIYDKTTETAEVN